jgi:hypothetical protein
MSKLKLGLTISGAVSLGAYEAGALAALITAAAASDGNIVIDAISGASAGAMTAVLTAFCVTHPDEDPYDVMWTAWVDEPSLANLRSRDDDAPLSIGSTRDHWNKKLTAEAGTAAEGLTVRLSLAVVSLGGLGYHVVVGGLRGVIDASTHLDWSNHVLSSTSLAADWARALDAAVTSGANAAGFAPRVFAHSEAEREQMLADGIQNPAPAGAWYTDGGTLDNEPFGRLLDMIGGLDDEGADDPSKPGDNRLVMLIHPCSDSLPGKSRWTDVTVRPAWLFTAWAALRILAEQSLTSDLQRLAKTNSRVRWLDQLAANLAGALGSSDPDVRKAVRDALTTSISWLAAQQQEIAEAAVTADGATPPAPAATVPGRARAETGDADVTEAELQKLFKAAFGQATGLAEKRAVQVDVISPAISSPDEPSDDLTAGEKIGHFFGFADERFRASDFRLGWENMRAWFADNLDSRGVLNAAGIIAAVDKVAGDKKLSKHVLMGNAGWGDLSLVDVASLSRVAAHATGVIVHDLAHRDGTRIAPAATGPASP